MQEIEPGEVHVDDETLERPALGRVVVEPDRQARFFDAGVQCRLPSGRTRHPVMLFEATLRIRCFNHVLPNQ